LVVIINEAVVAPAGTVTDAGTTADGSLLVRLTSDPLAGAAVLMVTTPVDVNPHGKVDGATDSPVTAIEPIAYKLPSPEPI